MPSPSHPQAQFVPISPALDLKTLVDSTNNFDWVTRVSRETLEKHTVQSLEQLVLIHVVVGGRPLIIENWGSLLQPWLFSPGWLESHLGKKAESIRDISGATDIPMTVGHYLRSLNQLTNQFTSQNYRDSKRQRLYLKDIDTPDEWSEHLKNILPAAFFYLNDCIESRTGGDGAVREPNEYGQMRFGKGVAPAGDLMSSLPEEMRAQNMMCYIGHEGTYTPAHREMCASLGHNIMVETSTNKQGEKAGSSIWFMTESKEREVVSEYFLSMLGHDIEVEKHYAQVNAWKKAPFNVWIVEQKVGDLILIPPMAPHQVWNRGTRTMKTAWNRTTVDTLELAIHEALPRARLVCRDEQYKNKAIIYYTLEKYYNLLERDTVEPKMWKYGRIKQILEDFKRLFALYTQILVSEMFSPTAPREKNVEYLKYDSNVTCSYCRCNIFNRFLTCESCIDQSENGDEDTYDVCMECYAMGRSCACISKLKWVEQWPISELTQKYEQWRNVVVQYDGYFDLKTSPQPLEFARRKYGKKPVAEICQEQLAIRPWNDIRKQATPEAVPDDYDDEPEADDEGRLKKARRGSKNRPRAQKTKTKPCHICFHHDWNWKLAFCTACNSAYCYGVLYRAFDLMPQTVMEDKEWKCPKCLKICSCAKCRKTSSQRPYSPKGTLLGHDTRKVADYRSVESLVDFSRTNLTWLRGDNHTSPQESGRMKKLKEKAEAEKAKEDSIDGSYLDSGERASRVIGAKSIDDHDEQHDQGMAEIDPLLRGSLSSMAPSQEGQVREVNGGVEHDAVDHTRPPHLPAPCTPNDLPDRAHGQGLDPYTSAAQGTHLGAEYPSRLLVPAANLVSESSYPDPSNIGQGRMMGIGYYQQSSNTIDRILYDPPDETGHIDPMVVEQSDFLKALLQNERSKKRKGMDEDGNENTDDHDLEFFMSKKQKKLLESKKQVQFEDGQGYLKSTKEDDRSISLHRPSRTSAGQRHVFGDVVDVDAVLKIPEEDLLLPREPKTGDLDLVLATKAMTHLKKTSSQEQASPHSTLAQQSPPQRASHVKSPDSSPKSKSGRHSARRERQEAGVAATSSATRIEGARPRRSLRNNELQDPVAHADIASKSKNTSQVSAKRGRPRRILNSPVANVLLHKEVDSSPARRFDQCKTGMDPSSDLSRLSDGTNDFGNQIGSDAGKPAGAVPRRNTRRNIVWKGSEEDSAIMLGQSWTEQEPTLAKKRRGHPPREHAALKTLDKSNFSASPRAQRPPRMLSLKEKLALKGKSAKIVASNTRQSVSGMQSQPTHAVPYSGSKASLEAESGRSIDVMSTPDHSSPFMTPSSAKHNNLQARPSTSPSAESPLISAEPRFTEVKPIAQSTKTAASVVRSQSQESQRPQLPLRKGPTVVRLGSPCEDSASEMSYSDDDSSDENEEIPAIKPMSYTPRERGLASERVAMA